MMISLIVAIEEQGGIGNAGKLPWQLSSDLKRFKNITMGHHLIMGRKTYESIGRPLPGRISIVVTRDPRYQAEGCIVVHSLEQALASAKQNAEQEVFVVGGGQIYAQALPFADRIYLTQVHAHIPCDVYFPPLRMDEWDELESTFIPAGEHEQYAYTIKRLQRKQ